MDGDAFSLLTGGGAVRFDRRRFGKDIESFKAKVSKEASEQPSTSNNDDGAHRGAKARKDRFCMHIHAHPGCSAGACWPPEHAQQQPWQACY